MPAGRCGRELSLPSVFLDCESKIIFGAARERKMIE